MSVQLYCLFIERLLKKETSHCLAVGCFKFIRFPFSILELASSFNIYLENSFLFSFRLLLTPTKAYLYMRTSFKSRSTFSFILTYFIIHKLKNSQMMHLCYISLYNYHFYHDLFSCVLQFHLNNLLYMNFIINKREELVYRIY